MGAKHRTAVIAAALMVLAAVVPLASANGPMGGIEDVIVSVPTGGDGVATRAPMPADSTTGTIGVTATSDDPDFIASLTEMLSSAPTRGARVVTCVFLNTLLAREFGEESFDVSESSLQLLFIYTCVHLALNMQQAQNGAGHALRRAAAGGCKSLPVSVPIHITKTASGYTATVSGMSSTPKKLRFRVSCKRTAKSLQTTVKSASRAGKLTKAIGPILGVGFASSSSSPGKLKIALGVR